MKANCSSALPSGLCLSLVLGGLAVMGPPAYAQTAETQGSAPAAEAQGAAPAGEAQAMTGSGIIVTAPRRVGRSSTTGAPIELVSASRAVNIRDIDITSQRGQLELNRRITTAARDACRELERRYPIGSPDARTCERHAQESTRAEIDAMRALAMQTATPPAAGAAAAPASSVEPATPPRP